VGIGVGTLIALRDVSVGGVRSPAVTRAGENAPSIE
jgi:hypothetical protein